jgi:16S rRNA (guanine966-N2)-methyltransferase
MRIVAGSFRGRPIAAPRGRATRPTADRARQALFNVLEHAAWSFSLEGARVLDLFAGSGALGLEALSRGAGFCLFVDTDDDAREAIRNNAEGLGVAPLIRFEAKDAARLGARPADQPPFSLAFLDPPYGADLLAPALAGLAAGGWLEPDATLVAEQASAAPPLKAQDFALLGERRWGAARVSFLRAPP